MKSDDLLILQSGSVDKIQLILQEFNKKYTDLFDFTEFNVKSQWSDIWNSLFTILKKPENSSIYPEVLSSIRILTRDKNNINLHNLQNDFEFLLIVADLGPPDNIKINTKDEPFKQILDSSKYKTETIIEALKCLCNLIYQSFECQKLCLKNSSTYGVLKRVRDPINQPHEIELFDMKLLFLITAFELDTRPKVKDDLNGLTYLTEWLDIKCKEENKNEKHLDLICEILKVLFNITANTEKNSNENEILNRRLTNVLKNILYEFGTEVEMNGEGVNFNVITQTVNLLTNIPTTCLSELLVRKDKCTAGNHGEIYEGQCIKSLDILLQYLKLSLTMERERLPSILIVLIKCTRCTPTMRHYIRSIILPPLKDVTTRPEIGNELRNYLCRFLTAVDLTIRDLSAELLFVCCKENVSRMIKYTGYGNAAGLFAAKGILDCRKQDDHDYHAEYSSDSEDSDTEEYKQVLHNVNPVLGCYELPKSNPLEGMSEEQKEFEAMELVKLMDKLHKQGIVRPCRIGNDGKPQPLEHILELQEELPQQQIEHKNKT